MRRGARCRAKMKLDAYCRFQDVWNAEAFHYGPTVYSIYLRGPRRSEEIVPHADRGAAGAALWPDVPCRYMSYLQKR